MKKAGILIAFLISLSVMGQEKINKPNVSVSGVGMVKVTPDEVMINVSVNHEGSQAKEVKAKTDNDINQVLEFLKGENIASKDVKTEYVQLNKRYNHNSDIEEYNASQAISIKLRDIKKYESIIAGLMQSGINRINGIQFQSSEIEKYKTEARIKAIQNAKEKASTYAEALGQDLGKAYQVAETTNYGAYPVFRANSMQAESSGSKKTLAVGEMEVKIKIEVAFILH